VRSLLKLRSRRSPSTASAFLRATRSNDFYDPCNESSYLGYIDPLFSTKRSSRRPSFVTNRSHSFFHSAHRALLLVDSPASPALLQPLSPQQYGWRTGDPKDLRPFDVSWTFTTCYAYQLLFYWTRRRILHDLSLQGYATCVLLVVVILTNGRQ
jgi:hypothetical protein